MQSVAGTQLDSDLVEIFCNIPKNKVLACKPEKVDFDIGDSTNQNLTLLNFDLSR